MSRDWTPKELQAASTAMQKMGNLSYEEFCKEIEETERMEVKFDLTGITRKELVKAAEQIVGAKATYKKLPTLAYELSGFTFTKEGTLVWDKRTAPEAAESLVTALTEQGFRVLAEATDPPHRGQGNRGCADYQPAKGQLHRHGTGEFGQDNRGEGCSYQESTWGRQPCLRGNG